VLRHTNTYSKADLTDKQLSQEQKHGQQYFLDIILVYLTLCGTLLCVRTHLLSVWI